MNLKKIPLNYVMFKKLAAVFYRGCVFRPDKTRAASFLNDLKKHSTKKVSFWTQNDGSNYER